MAWKYVIVRAGNQEFPFIFPDKMVHAQMADLIQDCLVRMSMVVMPLELHTVEAAAKLREQIVPVAAGDVTFDIGQCSGGSETLKLRARPGDTHLIGAYNYEHGVVPETHPCEMCDNDCDCNVDEDGHCQMCSECNGQD